MISDGNAEPAGKRKKKRPRTIKKKKLKLAQPIMAKENNPKRKMEEPKKVDVVESSKKFIGKETIDFLLYDDDENDDLDVANQIADKNKFSKMSDEAKFKATLAIRKNIGTSFQPPKVRASVRETGNDTMRNYLKSMGNHELLRKEDEIILGRQIQIFVKWEAVRQDLEDSLMRMPTYAEWAHEVNTSVSELKKQIRRSQRAKAALIEANIRLVVSLARQSIKSGKTEISFQDACQEGIIGLAKACEKFDPEKGFRFSTYANWYIKRCVNENVIDQSRTVKLPYRVAMKINQIKITEVTLKDELGRKPTDKEVAEKLEISVDKLQFYREKSVHAFSLDKSITSKAGKGSSASTGGQGSGRSGSTVGDTILDPSSNPSELVSNEMLQNDVRRLITTLSPREQAVIRMRFGVDDGKPRSVDDIAEKFKVSREKIKKVEGQALLKLKQPFRSNSVKCYISDL